MVMEEIKKRFCQLTKPFFYQLVESKDLLSNSFWLDLKQLAILFKRINNEIN